MKTYTDTQRIDFVIKLFEARTISPILKQIEVCSSVTRSTIDAAMRQEEAEQQTEIERKRTGLLEQRAQIDRQLAALNSQQ